ncbi:hypothetical protein [Campylobacter cuniculorum]|uniref:O-fucosyltransferase family protein n=1 Tax=Campylobacter cuniculorum TaxID=374106 RepID=A0ABX6TVF0_9BACT|nr:hypothetical protein [Campylobacter cuniculorum]QOR03700.1 hypothetical protein A0071_05760 [Campylobacter cuniculorum]
MDKKSDSWIVAARPDGFGQRFCSILVGLYLAKKLQFNFGFVWENSIDIKADLSSKNDKNKNFLGVAMDKAELIFGENFIKNYLLNPSIDSWVDSYSHPLTYGMRIMKKAKTFKQLKQKSRFDRKWGYYACPYLPSDFLVDCERKECLEELGNIYKSIPFSKEFTDIQKRVHDISLSLNHNFIALHIRGGGSRLFSFYKTGYAFSDIKRKIFSLRNSFRTRSNGIKSEQSYHHFWAGHTSQSHPRKSSKIL